MDGEQGTSEGQWQLIIAALQTGQAKMSVTAGVVMYWDHIQKLGVRAVHARALRIRGFSGEIVGAKASLRMPAVSKVDTPGAKVWCISDETSFLWT